MQQVQSRDMPVPPPSVQRVSRRTRPHGEACRQWDTGLQVMAVISVTAHAGCSTTTLKQLHTHAEASVQLSGNKRTIRTPQFGCSVCPNALLVLLCLMVGPTIPLEGAARPTWSHPSLHQVATCYARYRPLPRPHLTGMCVSPAARAAPTHLYSSQLGTHLQRGG